MDSELRLWRFTEGVRGRMAAMVGIGLLSVGLGVARLGLLGWLIAAVYRGAEVLDLVLPALLVGLVMALRGVFEYVRVMMAHETAARVQTHLRRVLYDKIAVLGPGTVGRWRSGAVTLVLTNAIEQLETYFGQCIPQFLIALLTPVLIFAGVAFIDLPVASVMCGFALIALFAPALWHKIDGANAKRLMETHGTFAAEFLDSVQGLGTLKAFGQGTARTAKLEGQADVMFRDTMRVLATNMLGRGITDSSIACGAAAALALGVWRLEAGVMSLSALLIILMLGVEVFRPMRELRNVLHQGMVGLAAAQSLYQVLDTEPDVTDGPAVASRTLTPEIAFEGVRFRYPGTQRVIHDGLDFTLKPGERVGLVGSSGGGKSSIVRLILRFYDPEAGRVTLGGYDLKTLSFAEFRSMIAVVSQDAVLFHGTVGENICMGDADTSQVQVEAAARAANIHDFIVGLPQGYDTVIGEKGLKLSGGQRQRMAIARALLRDAPILILDEALSAVDAENEAVINQALDRLMAGRTTLILAHRLSSVIGCDRILVLDQGHIVENGPHHSLMAAGGLYVRLMAEQARDAEAAITLDDGPGKFTTTAATSAPATAVQGALTEGIVKADGLGWFALVRHLTAMIRPWKGQLTATFTFGVLRVLTFAGVGLFSALILADLKNGLPYDGWLWALAVIAPLAGVLHWCESLIAHDMAFRLLAQMRVDLFRKLEALAPAYLVRRRTGDLMSLVTHDVDLIEYFFAHTVAPAFVAVLVPVAVLIGLAAIDPWLAFGLLPFLVAVGVSPFLMRGRVDRLGSQAREAAGELGAVAVDSIQGLGEIVAFGRETAQGDRLDRLSERHMRLRLPFFRELTLQQVLLEVMTGLGGLTMVMIGGALTAGGQIDRAWLPFVTLLAMAAFLPVSEIAQVGRQLADTLGATRRLFAVTAEPVPVTDGPGVPAAAANGMLTLDDVSFGYPGQGQVALSHVTLTIPAGKTVALVGLSGAGKTTTAQLLMRFWDPGHGRITLDGHDLRDFALDDLRQRIALVAQDTYLFNDSLRNNILIGRPQATEAELEAAVADAALGGLVADLPDGLDTPVGERGTSLSGGQRQRVAIARAFLKDAPVLILDEATSHLDAASEQAVRGALERLQVRRTTVVIAHRLSTIRDADLIVVLDGGQIAESGQHEELLARDGLYTRLVSRQLGAGAGHRVALG